MTGKKTTVSPLSPWCYLQRSVAALIIGLGVIAAPSYGQSTPAYEITEAETVQAPRVRDLIDDYLNSKGWSEGENVTGSGSSRKTFFVAVGVGTIAARRDSPGYVSSRYNAFQKAFLAAQKNMVQFLEADVAAAVASSYTEPSSAREQERLDTLTREGMALQAAKAQVGALSADIEEYAQFQSGATAATQAEKLLRFEIDNALRERGFDPNQPVEQQQLASILAQEEFQSAVRIVANSRVAGLQAFKVFEVLPEGNQGQIGVVAIFSNRLHNLACALFTGNEDLVPEGAPRKPLKQQIPLDDKVLLSTFGVTAKVDENGQLALVAYGQAGAKTGSSRSLSAAEEKARVAAIAQIRFFAGAMVKTLEETANSETMTELSSGIVDVVTDESYEEKIEAFAGPMKISGLKTIHRWNAQHPLTGHFIAGQVVTWQPSSAKLAKEMKQQLNGGSSTSSNETAQSSQPAVDGKAGSFTSQGAEGSNDF